MQLENKSVIVTGVSKGIGLEIVKQLIEKKCKVAGWGRSAPDFKHPDFHFIQTDVSDFESVQNSFFNTQKLIGQDIRILINNAGFGVKSSFTETSVEDWKAMFDTNVHGIFYCSKMVIPSMQKADEGHIINISSIAGLNGVGGFAGYVGTKHAVRGISHSMYLELRDFGIKVSTIYPGSVNTNFFDTIEGIQANENMMRPEDVAQTVIQTLETHENGSGIAEGGAIQHYC